MEVMVMFVGFDETDGSDLYDTKDAAIERAKILKKWGDDPNAKIFIHREWIPLWLAHLLQETWFQWVAYREFTDSK